MALLTENFFPIRNPERFFSSLKKTIVLYLVKKFEMFMVIFTSGRRRLFFKKMILNISFTDNPFNTEFASKEETDPMPKKLTKLLIFNVYKTVRISSERKCFAQITCPGFRTISSRKIAICYYLILFISLGMMKVGSLSELLA